MLGPPRASTSPSFMTMLHLAVIFLFSSPCPGPWFSAPATGAGAELARITLRRVAPTAQPACGPEGGGSL